MQPDDISALLRAAEGGDDAAGERLFERVYDELRRIARRQLRGAPRYETLDTTGLVHEAYLKLGRGAAWSTRDRAHFYALAAQAMRQVLVDQSRRRTRRKRGLGAVALTLDRVDVGVAAPGDELLALDQALLRLERADPDLARLVELRFFAGLSVEEVAELRGVTGRTVKNHWRLARAFLLREMSTAADPP
ncbi:MAG: ECF-type sigma factor [Thermoanaerobaculales bacterium]|nr:ECF-type sigma factor [Thermoanaerobaculales bacterium]